MNASIPPHEAIVGHRLRRIGFALIAASLVALAGLFGLAALDDQWAVWIQQWAFWIIQPVLLVGVFLWYRSRQHLARVDSSERLHDPRPPVVLLRGFQSDASARAVLFPLYLFTFEEHLAAALQPIGPFVALGQPEEALPPPGASRFYETDQTWKDRVIDLFKRARLVVLIFGTSPALLWEAMTAFQMLKPQQLLILGVGRNTPREYEELSRILKETTGRELPNLQNFRRERRRGFEERSGITFGEGWRPRILRMRAPGWRSFASVWTGAHVHFGLEPVFRANGIEWHPYPVSALEVLYCLFFVILCLLMLGAFLLTFIT
jgi:hypothetical protein